MLSLQLGRLTALDHKNLETEKAVLTSQINYLKTVLIDPKVTWKEIKNETSELKRKFGTPRKSEIVKSVAVLSDEDVSVFHLIFFL